MMSRYGDPHKTDPNLFWNGEEWEEKKPSYFWDFNLKNDWVVGLVCAVIVGLGVIGLIALKS